MNRSANPIRPTDPVASYLTALASAREPALQHRDRVHPAQAAAPAASKVSAADSPALVSEQAVSTVS
jgi:hypothetical protein